MFNLSTANSSSDEESSPGVGPIRISPNLDTLRDWDSLGRTLYLQFYEGIKYIDMSLFLQNTLCLNDAILVQALIRNCMNRSCLHLETKYREIWYIYLNEMFMKENSNERLVSSKDRSVQYDISI